MDPEVINTSVVNFLKSISTGESPEHIIQRWMSAEHQGVLFPGSKRKPYTKSAYFLFCADERERLRNEDPPVVKRDAVHEIMSKNWGLLKEKGGPDYEKYVTMSAANSKHIIATPEYEVTKPFHKFSLQRRKIVEEEFPGDTAMKITSRLKDEWNELSETDKGHFTI
jgi:hypothetical protein